MDLADATAHRALAYVAATQRQGYVMTVEELEAYLARPSRRTGTPGTLDRTVMTTNIHRAFRAQAQPLVRALQASLGARWELVEGTPGTPAESVADWLSRISWLRVDDGRVRTTPLGDAMLAHLEQASLEEEIPVGVVLDQGDELATARVISQIAEVGRCAVLDPFFSMNSLLPIVHATQTEQVLTGSGDQAKLAGLAVALDTTKIDRPFEVRKSGVFHDRFVVPPAGPVWLLGTSLTGLGNRLSVMVELRDDTMSDAIRREFREAWESAEVVQLEESEDEEPPEYEEEGEEQGNGEEPDDVEDGNP